MTAPVLRAAFASKLPAPNIERLADDALLAMSKLRDALVTWNENTAACRIDEAMETTLATARAVLEIQ